jgi:hypothetical protein
MVDQLMTDMSRDGYSLSNSPQQYKITSRNTPIQSFIFSYIPTKSLSPTTNRHVGASIPHV